MDDTELLKFRELQEDVVNMRRTVPEEIRNLYGKHMLMLKIRRAELENDDIEEIPKLKLKRKPMKNIENVPNINFQESIVKLNARFEALDKVKQFRKKSDQHSS